MIDSLVSTWLALLQRCEDVDLQLSIRERHLLHRAMRSLAGDIDTLFSEEAGLIASDR
jgi:hypothetical protein